MKKSKFITKYDYIAYYTKQPAMWFFTNDEIEKSFEEQFEKAKIEDNSIDHEEDEFSTLESSSFSIYKENYKENKDIDDTNTIIVEGRILDQKSKEHVKNEFSDLNDLLIVDFDDDAYKGLNNNELSEKTNEFIKSNKNLILFQPTFIDSELEIITKCDAVVITEHDIKVIETKGTSTCKFGHFLDLFYQKRIIEKQELLKNKQLSLFLCLIKYEKLDIKDEVSFAITEYISLSKGGYSTVKKTEYEKADLKLGIKYKKEENISINITEICNLTFDEDIFNNSLLLEKANFIKHIYQEFNSVIKNLWDHKNKMNENDKPKNFLPAKEDKSQFKDTDTWQQLKKLYSSTGYELFNYSGNVVKQKSDSFSNLKPNQFNLFDYIKKPKTNPNKYLDLFASKNNIVINQNNSLNLLNNLKPKKVYFDFETINTSIRVVDDSFPFVQIVTQCSVIKDHSNGVLKEKCRNLVIDPKKINKEWFKEIIDSLYEEENEYSYVVYNKSFEESRIKEMMNFIDEDEYRIKGQRINNNLFDLADFFDLNKETIFIKELGGFYSIKKVLPLVEKYSPELYEKTGCLDYKKLNVQNGLDCQQKTTARFFDLLNEEEWEQLVEDVSVYCENDVRAMVAVELFVKKILNKEIEI